MTTETSDEAAGVAEQGARRRAGEAAEALILVFETCPIQYSLDRHSVLRFCLERERMESSMKITWIRSLIGALLLVCSSAVSAQQGTTTRNAILRRDPSLPARR